MFEHIIQLNLIIKIRDVHCRKCQVKLGWFNEFIEDTNQVIPQISEKNLIRLRFLIRRFSNTKRVALRCFQNQSRAATGSNRKNARRL